MITFVFHVLYSSACAFAVGSLFGHLSPAIAVFSLVVGWTLGAKHARILVAQEPALTPWAFRPGEAGALEALIAAVVLYACARHFGWLFFRGGAGWMTLNVNNLGDLPLHIGYIKAMASGASFPIANPEYAQETLRYPFGLDLYNALWQMLGVNLQGHLFVTGMLLTVATLIVLRFFGSWWAMGAFFFSGGWAELTRLAPGLQPQRVVDWKNMLLAVFITQRGVMIAVPVGLIIIELWRKHVSGETRLTRETKTALGLAWGILPLFHAHAFFAVSILLLLITLIEKRAAAFRILFASRVFFFAVIPAFIFVWRTTDGFRKASVSGWESFLQTRDAAQGFELLWLNFGAWLFVPLFLIAAIARVRDARARMRAALRLTMALVLFIFLLNYKFAPWSWDNIKLLIFPYLLLAQLAFELLDPHLPRLTRYPIAIALLACGFLAVASSMGRPASAGTLIFEATALNAAEGAVVGLSPDAIFIADQAYNHPLIALGRFRVLGYAGHLSSHAIDASVTTSKHEAFMRGAENWRELARDLHADFIYWSLNEKVTYGDGPRPWMSVLENVSRVPGIAVYRLPQGVSAASREKR